MLINLEKITSDSSVGAGGGKWNSWRFPCFVQKMFGFCVERELLSPCGKYATIRTIDKRRIRSFRINVLLILATRPALGRKHPPIQRTREVFLACKATVEVDCLLSFVLRFSSHCIYISISSYFFVASRLTRWGRVTQICVFTLQLCKTDDANLRF